MQACIDLNYDVGLNLRDAPWPELKAALASKGGSDVSWDILFALALVDGRAGDGDPFWAAYATTFLPSPDTLTLPFCQNPAALRELQHPQVQAAAVAQQARLSAAFPHLAAPADPHFEGGEQGGGATLIQWGLACVRSRAFQLSKSHFAYIPFLDMANHSAAPSGNFRGSPDSRAIELVAAQDLEQGQEVTLSYTGSQGATNRRLLVQYGFVIEENASDRLDLGLRDGYIGTKPLRSNPYAPAFIFPPVHHHLHHPPIVCLIPLLLAPTGGISWSQ
jgi:hypothetical protein